MTRLTGGEILKRYLVQENVRYVFGVPGDQLYPILDAIYKDKRIDFVTMRHEAAAAHAADAWARTTGEPGVCLGTVGPGAANLVGGVYPAFADSIPMIVITAQNQAWRSYPDHGSMQALDQISLFKAVTKWNALVSHWSRIPELTQRAFRMATSGEPGPVHLDFPSDVLFKPGDEDEIKIVHPSSYRPTEQPVGDPSLIDKAAMMLVKAKLPLIHAGGGILRSGASKELIELAEYLQAPVTTSMSGRSSIPEDHPLCLIPGSPGTGALVAQVEADVVLLVGGRLGDIEMWGQPPMAWSDSSQQRFIQIDISGDVIGLNRQVDIGIVGDAKLTLCAILETIEKYTSKKEERESLQVYKQVEKSWLEEYAKISRSDSIPIHPLQLIREVREFFPRDAITVVDGGNTAVWCLYLNRVYEPNTYLSCVSGDSGHLGAGIPYAIAAKLAVPSKQVYCITGDGAFGFNIQELETASRLNLPVIFIVANDLAWGMIKSGQTMVYSKRHIGVDLSDIRYDKVAQAMNCYGERVVEPAEIKLALQRAVDSGLPAVLDVEIDREVIPPDFEVLAAVWLEGCEFPEAEEPPKEKVPVAVASAGSS
ncbi:MAG: thiamine pyrophosphate-binding protein [Phycisphaerales bacterium]|nr:MAG: thiamine pyrophosphate-binding protein [Phycisphaerales bacterium]